MHEANENQQQKKTVLVVDDAPSNIHLVSSILKEAYKVRIATDGAKALQLVKVNPPPDLILLDVMMPGIDGYEVCSRLKSDPCTRDIPVIFLTGQTETSDETRGFSLGAVDYIHKPFSPAVVEARVNTHLVLREIRDQLAQQLHSIQQELQTAREIQFSILPRQIPRVAGLDIAARYIPMTAVAGDFYDFIAVDEKHIGIFIGDVSGHGMPAALIASMLKIALAAEARNAADPAALLLGLNRALCGKFDHHYVTAAYAYFDMEKHVMRYAGAGHPPILYGRFCEGVKDILENGMFLGKFDFATYSSVEVPLRPGDWCLLYTDGIPETTDPADVQFGDERFRTFLNEQRCASADQRADGLIAEISRWSARAPGDEPEDDITMVAVHVTQ